MQQAAVTSVGYKTRQDIAKAYKVGGVWGSNILMHTAVWLSDTKVALYVYNTNHNRWYYRGVRPLSIVVGWTEFYYERD